MRLTLRTLLAYLDEVLEPGDTQELATKIRESDFASGLVHRIRSAMSRLRLSCPEPMARGLAEDANAVGEYIDSTLTEDRIADFERVCLESDMHLAEVASCHQIVTWVVREPAQVPFGLRERMHELGGKRFKMEAGGYQRVDEALAELDEGDVAWKGAHANGSDNPPLSSERRPDYMAAGRGRTAAPWIVVTLALLLLVVGYLMGTVDDGRRAAEAPASSSAPAASNESAALVPATEQPELPAVPIEVADSASAQQSPDLSAAETAELGGDLPPATPQLTELGVPPEALDAASPSDDAANMSGADSRDSGLPTAGEPGSTGPAELVPAEPTSREALVEAAATGDMTGDMTGAPTGEPTNNGLPPSNPSELVVDEANDGAPAVQPPKPAPATSEEAVRPPDLVANPPGADEAETESPPVDVGRYISVREVMAYWDPTAGLWKRFEPRAPVKTGTRLRVPSAFRPQLFLGKSLQMTLVGRSELSLGQPAAGTSPIVRINYGRAMFVILGQESDRVALLAGGRALEVILSDTESEFAVEVSRSMMPGEDPTTAVRQPLVQVWVTSGRVGVREMGQVTRAVESGQEWRAAAGEEAELVNVDELPAWLEGDQLSDIDRTALLKVEPMLQYDRSLTLSLSEAAESRRQEVRSLAARCLASLDRFEPLTLALADPKQHPSWQDQFQELQAAIARSPETANRVKEALATTAGPDADDQFRMLWGYTKAQLEGGAALKLIDELESSSLARRVLAFQNLYAATQKTLYYRPEKPPARRKEAATQWRRQLTGGQISIQPMRPISVTN